jgi:hypothetical protein
MTAIIKNRFRVQNAKDFLENFVNHPRMKDNQKAPIIDDITVLSATEAGGPATARLNFSWDLDIRVNPSNSTQVKNDAVRGLYLNNPHIKDRNHYLFIGKSLPWGTTTTSELTPPKANDTLFEERAVWEEMLSLKKITDLNASLVIPRFDWDESQRTIYKPFDDKDPSLYQHPTPDESALASQRGYFAGSFYVLNDEMDLFVCLENGGGARSLKKPIRSANATNLIDYRDFDGYLWKYMFTVKPADVARFLTDSWIPVKTLGDVPDDNSTQYQVEQATKKGEVLSFIVDNQGSGYTKILNGKFFTIGTTPTENGVAEILGLTEADVPSVEPAYYVGAQLHVTAGADIGSVYDIINYDATMGKKELTINGSWAVDGTSEFMILPKIEVVTNSTTPIKLRPVISQGKIVSVRILSRGENATFVRTTVSPGSAQVAGGVQAKIRAVLGPIEGLGKDPEKDLGAFFVMMSTKLDFQEGAGDFPVDNDYRQIGIIRDVKNIDGSLATDNTLVATKQVKVNNVVLGVDSSVFRPDETFLISTDGGTTWVEGGQVLECSSSTTEAGFLWLSFFRVIGQNYALITTDGNTRIKGADSQAQATVVLIRDEEVKKFEGQILYLENRRPILRAPDQIEDIKAIVEF